MTTIRKEPRRVRRARRSAAFHADRARLATTPKERYQAAEYALRAASKNSRSRRKVRDLRDNIADNVQQVLERAAASAGRQELYQQKLAQAGSESQRLSTALMCLRGAIDHLPDTERDRSFEHYTEHFQAETSRIHVMGGVRS